MITNKAAATSQSQALALYYYDGCPFCHMTLKALDKIKQDGELDIELRHIRRQPQYRTELIKQGGKPQVPCLRIELAEGKTTWLYESRDIIDYLRSSTSTNE
jgi:glutaredoxin